MNAGGVHNTFTYIKNEAKEKGIHFTYMHVVMAALVRIYALRPVVNRFIVNSKIYQRKDITFSITVKKSLTDEGEEGLVKLHFKGNESIYEVKDIIDKAVAENLKAPDAVARHRFKAVGLGAGHLPALRDLLCQPL